MSKGFRVFLLCSLLSVPFLGFSTAHAASFTIANRPTVCLDDEGGFSTNGTLLRSFPCNVTFAQDWSFDGVRILGPGTTVAAGKCIDVKGGGTASGTPIQLFDCSGTRAQQWSYSNSHLINLGSGKCLDVGLADLQHATIQPCNDSAGQRWVIR